MTGWTKRGKGAHQREKIYALIRCEGGLTVYEIAGKCWKMPDKDLAKIQPPAIRRCLQELMNHNPPLAKKNQITERWIGLERYEV